MGEYKQYLVFNAETTGLDPITDQICHLSYIIADDMFNPIVSKTFFFSINEMSYGAERIHGLSKGKLEELSKGKAFKDYAKEIYEDFKCVDLIATHNIGFFMDFLYEELDRENIDIEPIEEIDKMCLMYRYTDVLKLGYNTYYEEYKYPKFEEIEYFLGIEDEDTEQQAQYLFNVNESEITRCMSKTTSAIQMLKAYIQEAYKVEPEPVQEPEETEGFVARDDDDIPF